MPCLPPTPPSLNSFTYFSRDISLHIFKEQQKVQDPFMFNTSQTFMFTTYIFVISYQWLHLISSHKEHLNISFPSTNKEVFQLSGPSGNEFNSRQTLSLSAYIFQEKRQNMQFDPLLHIAQKKTSINTPPKSVQTTIRPCLGHTVP